MKLGELIRKRKSDLRLSYRRMSEKAADQGFSLSTSAIHQLATDDRPDRTVEQQTLHALAIALDTSFAEVILCWLATLGVELSADVVNRSDVRGYVTLTEGMSESERERALNVLRAAITIKDSDASGGVSGVNGDGGVVRALPRMVGVPATGERRG